MKNVLDCIPDFIFKNLGKIHPVLDHLIHK